MNIDIKDTLILDNNKQYIVISKANYNNQTYYYIVEETNKNNDTKFCYQRNDELIEITDNELIKKIVPLLVENSNNAMKEIIESIV